MEQQRIKEEPAASRPQVSSPALKEQSKVGQRQVKCSPSRGSSDERRSREVSPSPRIQHQVPNLSSRIVYPKLFGVFRKKIRM